MFNTVARSLILTLSAFALVGCDFFIPPDEPPTPSVGTDPMSCGETRDVEGLSGADSIELDISLATNFEVVPDFDPPFLGMRLTFQTDTAVERSLELWDPHRGLRLIPGSHSVDGDLDLELLGTSSLFSGSIALTCDQPAENCFNLTDDDNDGLVDCADLNCAQDPACQSSQADFLTLHLGCSEEPLEITTTLATTDDQRTLYRTEPGGFEQPGLEFWGGAEVVIRSVDPEVFNIDVTLGTAGLVCVAVHDSPLDAEVIECEDWNWFEAGAVVNLDPTEMPNFIEPLGAGFDSLSISVDCATP